jgi:hypothetical protein
LRFGRNEERGGCLKFGISRNVGIFYSAFGSAVINEVYRKGIDILLCPLYNDLAV